MNARVRGLRQYVPYVAAVLVVVAAANLVPDSRGDAVSAGPSVTTSTTPPLAESPVTVTTLPPAAPPTSTVRAAAGPVTSRPERAAEQAPQEEPDDPVAPTRLTIVAFGYTDSGTGVGDPEVPDDGLPVGAGPIGPTRVSFIRLSGTERTLGLVLLADAGAHRLPELAAVSACPIAEAWQPEQGGPMSESPAYDCSTSVIGHRVDDTTFTFDLSLFASPTAGHGFALVPGGDAQRFHVTFSTDTVAAGSGGGET